MAKLIYSEALYSDVCSEGKLLAEALNTDVKSNSYYRSLLITEDGYFITHGRKFKMVNVDSQTINVGLSRVDGVITLTDNLTAATTTLDLPVWNLTEGDGITLTDNNGSWQIKQTAPVKEDSDTTFGVSYNNGILSFGQGTYDSLGRITSYSTSTSQHVDWVDQAIEEANIFYLLGSTESKANLGNTVKNSGVFIDFVNNIPQLNVSRLKVDGVGNIILDNSNTTLDTYINKKVDEAKTQALVYQGTVNPDGAPESQPYVKSVTGVTNGDVFKVTGRGFIKLKEGSIKEVKPGDLLIAKVIDSTFQEWDLIPSGDETETYIKYEDGEALSGTLTFKGNGVSYIDKVFTFTDTTYEVFTGATGTENGTAGLVPAPSYNQSGYYLSSDGVWAQLPTINNGTFTLKAGNDLIGESFTANGSNATYTIPYATEEDSATVSGVIKGSLQEIPTTFGWTQAKVIDGIIEYYLNTYSYTSENFSINNTNRSSILIGKFKTNGSDTEVRVPYADHGIEVTEGSITKVFGVVGTTSTLDASKVNITTGYYATPIIDGIVYYQNTWRPVKAYTPAALNSNGNISDIWQTSISTNALEFSSDFIAVDSDSSNGEELHITWAEVSKDGKITYAY